MFIPLVDLKSQYASIKNEITTAIGDVLESCAFAGGPFVSAFEKEFADFCNCAHAVGVGSGTDALWLCLQSLGIGHDDEVITVPNTFIATAEAISLCGAVPVLADVDEKTYTLDPDQLEKALTPKTKAIIPVHLFGQMADMDPIMDFAKAKGLFVVEDACQAHGATYKGKPPGAFGDAACFSFYPGKNLGAYGEAGAVVTNNAELAQKICILRDHGQTKRYHHVMIGANARMDGIQGAILSVKLKHLDKWTQARQRCAHAYSDLLQKFPEIITPAEADYGRHVYHIYAIRHKNRDVLMDFLQQQGIHCGIHYPIPIHSQQAYAPWNLWRGSFPISEKIASEFLSLPLYPELTDEQIEYVADSIGLFIEKSLNLWSERSITA